jgi:photosystem II stability/assembly factor-like uncharacterized protein
MLNRRLIIASLAVAAILAGCRGGSGINAVPSGSGGNGGAPVASIQFVPIGPTHMSDGFPTSGKVNAVAVNPTNSNIIYTAGGRGTGLETNSSAGILETTDGGSTWKSLTNGLTDSSGDVASSVNALWIDPANPSVLLAATEYDGIFRTSDGGSTWKNVFSGGHATQFASFGSALYATDDSGILTSTDDGQTWSVSLRGTKKQHPTAFGAVQSSSGKAFYAGMIDGHFYTFANNKWTLVSRLPFQKNTGTAGSSRMIHQIAVDPFAPSTVYVSTNDGAWDQNLFGSIDGGKTWTAILPGAYSGLGTQAIAFSQVHKHQLYVGADGTFYNITGDGSANPPVNGSANLKIIDIRNLWTAANGNDDACWVASDQGLDYTPACTSGNYTDTVVSASAAIGLARRFTVANNGKTVFASLQDFDSHYTSNGGSSWSLEPFYEDGFNELRPGNSNYCYAYDEASGLSRSTNGCASFSGGNSSISPSRIMTTPIAFDPKTPTTMYFTSGPMSNLFYGPKGVFKSTDGGITVSKLSWGFTWPGAIVVDQTNGSHILVCDYNAGLSSLSVTTDGGTTWTKSTGVIPTGWWYAMTISPVNPKIVLASSVDTSNNVFVLQSTDGGKTFTKISVVTNAPLIRGRIGLERHHLLATRGESMREREARKEEGQAFVYSPEREIKYNQDVTTGTPDVAITTLRGAYLSSDNGKTWARLDNGLIAHSFWGIRWFKGYLYLASDGQGVVHSTTVVQQARKR